VRSQFFIKNFFIIKKFNFTYIYFSIFRIKHSNELDGKSTVAHAKIIAPDDVSIYTHLEIPKYENSNRLLLLFPGSVSNVI
jgi:hypothetical protein